MSLGRTMLRILATTAVCMTYSYMIVRDLAVHDSEVKQCQSDSEFDSIKRKKSSTWELFSYREIKATRTSVSKYADQEHKRPNFIRYLRGAYIVSMSYHGVMIIKYILLCALSTFQSLQQYGWLDCFILGRFALTPRLSKASKFVALFLTFFHFLWRVIMVLRLPKIRLEWAEFLQYNYDEVLFEEIRAARVNSYEYSSDHQLSKIYSRPPKQDPTRLRLFYVTSLFHRTNRPILRPNRTIKGRQYLIRFFVFYWTIGALIIISLVSFLVVTLTPTCFTKLGFEQSYDVCARWITKQTRENNHSVESYSYIYTSRLEMSDLEKSRDRFILEWQDLRPYNLYNIIKLIFDYFDNLIIWYDTIVAFAVYTFVGMILSVDVVIYFVSLRSRLRKLNARLGQMVKMSDRLKMAQVGSSHYEIQAVQALIIDYFMQIDKYNAFANFFTMFVMLLWITYTFCFCSWFVRSEWHVVFEWYAIEALSTVFVIMIITTFGVIDSYSRQLYSLITRAMALDNNVSQSKKRWMIILDYYNMNPIFCFRLFRSYKISVFFCLHVS